MTIEMPVCLCICENFSFAGTDPFLQEELAEEVEIEENTGVNALQSFE